MHATHPIDVKNVIIDAALHKKSYRENPHKVDSRNERREKFLNKHKDTMLFVKI